MDKYEKLMLESKRLLIYKYPKFASELASANISFRRDLKYKTAATDGKDIYFDPEYFESLTEDDRLFLIAHELMHIKFNHVYRQEDKNGNKRDPDVWNEATDAIINANLQRDGFKIKEGYVNRPEALRYSAEAFYEKLLKEKQNQNNNKDNNNEASGNKNGNNHIGDDHSLWEEAFEKRKKGESSNQANDNFKEKQKYQEIDESKEFEENRKERRKRAEEILKHKREELLKNKNNNMNSNEINLGNVGDENNSIDWELLVRREIEKEEIVWSKRRSIKENNYAYRLEENDIEDEAQTEVMIDVSGSVSINMVRAFLRMLKPLLKSSKLKVGCFNEKFWGMVEIKSINDIDNFIIPEGARGHSKWTEDWDLAVRSFTKKREINKIVFTDGIPGPGVMPKEDLKNENIIWIVYGNKNFKPCCGKVILISKEQLKIMQNDEVGRKYT